jgi:hypothetical protein
LTDCPEIFFMIWQKRKKRHTHKDNILELALLPACEAEIDVETDRLVLKMQRFKWQWLQRLVSAKRSGFIKIKLDETGTYFWQQLDGRASVGEIAREMAAKFDQDEMQMQERTGYFAKKLLQQDLVVTNDS